MRLTSFFVVTALCLGSQLSAATDAILKKQTQELVDAITAGDASVWQRYLHERATITTEDGEVFSKAKMVEGIKPLADGVSGTIKIIDFKSIADIDFGRAGHRHGSYPFVSAVIVARLMDVLAIRRYAAFPERCR